jgi:histidinol-phosphatase
LYERELEVAREIAEDAGSMALERFGDDVRAERKSDGSWVTDVDRMVESTIRARLGTAFPGHNVLGEETGLTGANGGSPAPGAPTWIVDPIDGTDSYLRGVPMWATLIALSSRGENVLGIVHAPGLRETYYAVRDGGAYLNGRPIRVSAPVSLSESTVVYGHDDREGQPRITEGVGRVLDAAQRARGFGDFWGHMLVARGAADVMIEPQDNIQAWDIAALEPIVRGAGGRQSGLDGLPWRAGMCISSCRTIHEQTLAILSGRS